MSAPAPEYVCLMNWVLICLWKDGSGVVYPQWLRFSLPVCFFFWNLQLCMARMKDGISLYCCCSNKGPVCLSLLCFLLCQSLVNAGSCSTSKSGQRIGSAHFQIPLLGEIGGNQKGWSVALETSFSMIISILIKFIGLCGICSMLGLTPNYMQVLDSEKLKGVWNVPSEHKK